MPQPQGAPGRSRPHARVAAQDAPRRQRRCRAPRHAPAAPRSHSRCNSARSGSGRRSAAGASTGRRAPRRPPTCAAGVTARPSWPARAADRRCSAAKSRARVASRPISTRSAPATGCSRSTSRAASFRRRRVRLRTTALPTFFVTVKPSRAGAVSSRFSACSTSPGIGRLAALRGDAQELGAACQAAGLRRHGRGLLRGRAATRATQADSRLRPLARRLASTLRPPTVAMRARNPCRRLRTSFDG